MSQASEPEIETEFDASRFNAKDNLVKSGDEINLTGLDPALKRIMLGLGWELNSFSGEALDVDASCFLLDKNGQTRGDSDFVFYNNIEGSEGAVKHNGDSRHGAGDGDDETISIDLTGVPFDVVRIMVVVSIYGTRDNDQTLEMVRNAYMRVVNSDRHNEELARYEFGDILPGHKETALIVAALDREGPKWYLRPMSEFYPGGLGEIARKFGIVVAEKG